jgi:hypothetical protein
VLLSEPEFSLLLGSFDHTAFRLELQPAYNEPSETETVRRFLTGDPQPPTEVPGLKAWYDQIGELVAQGKRVERVRIHDHPPTGYQRWERWAGAWNIKAGEVIRYLTRPRAQEIGLLPDAGFVDWWLLDSTRLITMRFDGEGRRVTTELVTDPATVVQAAGWRDLAVHHSTPDAGRVEAA